MVSVALIKGSPNIEKRIVLPADSIQFEGLHEEPKFSIVVSIDCGW